MKFPCCKTQCNSFLLFFALIVLFCSVLSQVSGGLTKEKVASPSLEFLQAKVRESAQQELDRIAFKSKNPKKRILGPVPNNPRTLGMMDRVFDAIGMNSVTWVPGLRSLMDMNSNGTAMEFIPLGRLLWKRFFGEGAARAILGL